MTDTEKILLGALYLLYLYESVFWIGAGQRVWTRKGSGWIAREVGPASFTLLNRLPIWGDLLLLRPGLVRTSSTHGESKADARALAKIGKRINRLWFLQTLCQMQALVLLGYVPMLLVTHRLVRFWPTALGLVAVLHLGIVGLAAVAVWRSAKRWAVLGSVAVNPMGAVRVLDAMAQAMWDTPLSPTARSPRKPSRSQRHPPAEPSPSPHRTPSDAA